MWCVLLSRSCLRRRSKSVSERASDRVQLVHRQSALNKAPRAIRTAPSAGHLFLSAHAFRAENSTCARTLMWMCRQKTQMGRHVFLTCGWAARMHWFHLRGAGGMGKRTPLGTLTPVSSQSAVCIFSPVLRNRPIWIRNSCAASIWRRWFVLKEKRVYFDARTESFSIARSLFDAFMSKSIASIFKTLLKIIIAQSLSHSLDVYKLVCN